MGLERPRRIHSGDLLQPLGVVLPEDVQDAEFRRGPGPRSHRRSPACPRPRRSRPTRARPPPSSSGTAPPPTPRASDASRVPILHRVLLDLHHDHRAALLVEVRVHVRRLVSQRGRDVRLRDRAEVPAPPQELLELLGGGLRVHPAVAEEPQHRVVIHGRATLRSVQRRAHGGQAGSLLLGAAGGVHHLVADCLLRARATTRSREGGREARRERVAGARQIASRVILPNAPSLSPPVARSRAGRAEARGRARSPRGPTSPSPSRASCGVDPRARRERRPQTPMNQITDNLPRTAASAREYPGRYGLIVGLITGRSPAPPLGERKSKNLRDRASFAFLDLDGWIKTLSLSLQPSHAISGSTGVRCRA